ncbi:MlrC C-terminal domain-containing protein [Streptomyces tuirus]|uniref:MlrC C-terminal domain-containing protein n=1 Tax=Streptomyces tuirus TaxID=68278 RepID=A0A941FAM8_9ACTN|nr:MlrC C-terminal domain-containing protein [Streptomyces tuirus]
MQGSGRSVRHLRVPARPGRARHGRAGGRRREVVLRVGSVHVIRTRLRKPYHHEHDFTEPDLNPRAADLVIGKDLTARIVPPPDRS